MKVGVHDGHGILVESDGISDDKQSVVFEGSIKDSSTWPWQCPDAALDNNATSIKTQSWQWHNVASNNNPTLMITQQHLDDNKAMPPAKHASDDATSTIPPPWQQCNNASNNATLTTMWGCLQRRHNLDYNATLTMTQWCLRQHNLDDDVNWLLLHHSEQWGTTLIGMLNGRAQRWLGHDASKGLVDRQVTKELYVGQRKIICVVGWDADGGQWCARNIRRGAKMITLITSSNTSIPRKQSMRCYWHCVAIAQISVPSWHSPYEHDDVILLHIVFLKELWPLTFIIYVSFIRVLQNVREHHTCFSNPCAEWVYITVVVSVGILCR